MEFNCFICNLKLTQLEQFFMHLKIYHSLQSNSMYKCGVINCSQQFTSFRSFSKHMKSEINNFNPINSKSLNNENLPSNVTMEVDSPENYSNSVVHDEMSHVPSINVRLLKDSLLKFTLRYYGKPNFSRKITLELQTDVIQLITKVIAEEIETKIMTNCTNPHIKKSLNIITDFCKNPFIDINTEYRFLKHLEDKELYEKPKIITLNNTVENIVLNNINTIDEKKSKGVIFPIKFQLKKYFELDGVLNSFLDNHNSINMNSGYTNFLNSELWKQKMLLHPNKLVIPYFLYFDEFEVNNPLGPHSSSILGVYYSFPTAPHWLRSNLKNIFIAALFNSKDLKSLGNDKVFYKLIDELIDLENNGVELKFADKCVKLYFSIGLIVGDNLGVNTVLGFSKSFSANHFCRFCCMPKSSTGVLASEIVSSLRNKINYSEDVLKNDLKLTGINENSIFNIISSFHVVENYSVDLMHDIFEGICIYNMCHIILNLINAGFFSLETLNSRKQSFDYGESEVGNMSPPLKMFNLSNKNIKMTAREMQTFVNIFSILVGDFVPQNDPVWRFFINFIEIIDLLLLSNYDDHRILLLEDRIKYHNTKYVELFKDALKPKHHLLTHYCRIIKKSGPLKYIWSYNFESKHKQLKAYTKNINSRINISISLGIKFCINFSELICNFDINSYTVYTPMSVAFSIYSSKYIEQIRDVCPNKNLDIMHSSLIYDKIILFGTIYKIDNVLITNENELSVYLLRQIICLNEKTIKLFCQRLDIIGYDKHLACYKVNKVKREQYVIKNVNEFKGPPIHLYNFPSYIHHSNLIRLKYF